MTPRNPLKARDFHLGDILSVTTGLLVSPRHIEGVYDILDWMTGDNLFTHQLPRAARECRDPLLRQHPDLADVQFPDEFDGKEHVEAWLAEQVERFGETRPVAPIDPERHLRIDPVDEMRMMRPDIAIDVVEIPEPGQSPKLKRVYAGGAVADTETTTPDTETRTAEDACSRCRRAVEHLHVFESRPGLQFCRDCAVELLTGGGM